MNTKLLDFAGLTGPDIHEIVTTLELDPETLPADIRDAYMYARKPEEWPDRTGWKPGEWWR